MEGLCFSAGLGELLNPSAELEEFLVEREFGASLLNFYPCKLTSDERKTIDFLFFNDCIANTDDRVSSFAR